MPNEHMEYKRRSFDSFCKKVLKFTARTIYADMKKQSEREIASMELTARDDAKMAYEDKYFADCYTFDVFGEDVTVADYELGNALDELEAGWRDIVLMSYFFDMSDVEIAERLNMKRRTVTKRRSSSLKKLKKIMESEDWI